MATPSSSSVSGWGAAVAFLLPLVTLAIGWVIISFMVMVGANGVSRHVDELAYGYIAGSVGLGLVCTGLSGAGAIALAKSGRMPLWGAVMLATSLAVLVEVVGSCGVFIAVGETLGSF